jgi:ABC-type oligopeptide transport system substrate-binding subunit
VLNKNSAILSNKKLRQAVCLSISDTDAKGAEYLSAATGYVPPSCIIAGKSATDVLADINTRQDAAKATQLWKSGLEELGASTAEFTVITTAEYEEVVKELVQGIQAVIGSVTSYGEDDRTISFSLKISVLSAEEYNDALARGEYDLAFCKFTTTTHNPLTLLDSLINDSYAGVVSDAREALNKAQSADAKTLVEKTEKCEKALMSDYSIKPVFFEASYYAEAKGVSGVSFHPGSGRVCFVNATRAE